MVNQPTSATDSAPHQRRRNRRLLIWLVGLLTGFISLLLILALMTWALLRHFATDLNPVLAPVINPLLERFVGPGSQVTIGHLDHTRLTLDSLTLNPDSATHIQASGVSLAFDLTRLTGGDLDSLSAESLLIQLTPDNSPTAQPASSDSKALEQRLDITLPVLTDLMSLPIGNIRLPDIQIETPDLQARLAADLNPQLWWLRGDADLPEFSDTVQLDARLQRSATADDTPEHADLLLLLSQGETLLAQLWAGLTQTESFTSADLRVQTDLPGLQQRLPMLSELPVSGEGLTLTATLSSPNDAVWPQQLTGTLQATLNTAAAELAEGTHLSPLQTTFSAEHPHQDSDWQIQITPGALRLTMTNPDAGEDTLNAQLTPISAQCRHNFAGCELATTLQGTLTTNEYSVDVAGHPRVDWQSVADSSARLPLTLTFDLPASESLPALHGNAEGVFSATLTPQGEWTLSAGDGLTLQTDAVVLPTSAAPTEETDGQSDWHISPMTLTALQQLQLSGDLTTLNQVHTTPWQLSLNPVRLTSGDGLIRIGKTAIRCEPGWLTSARLIDDLLANCSLATRLLPSDWGIWPVPDAQIEGPWSLSLSDSNQSVSASLNLTAANQQIQLRTRVQHDLKNDEGSLQWHLQDATLDWAALGMSQMANLTQVQLLNGRLSGQGWVDWQASDTGWDVIPDVMLRADDVGLIYNNLMTLDEGNVLLALRRPAMGQQAGDYLLDAQVSAGKLDNGITLSNILARSQTRLPADFSYVDVSVYEMHTDVLGGRVYTPLIRYDSRKDVNAFGIRLDHIQLSQIAELEAQAGINATGLLDGLLPVVLTAEGPSIPGGTLFARDPGGVVQYRGETADVLSKTNQGTGLAMQLLSDFRYDLLQSGVQYQPDGQLNLALKFEGHNPDFFDGQKTLLNVNLEYNLLDLLESLRLSNDVIQKIEDKYQ